MKFYLALLALVGIAESNGCALTHGSLGNKLNLHDLKRAQHAGRGIGPAQGASGAQFACFPVATQVRQAYVPPTKVTIAVTPYHGAVRTVQPTYSSVQSSFFPTVDYYPWANNVPQFTSQTVTTAPVTTTTTYATNLPTQTLTNTPIVVEQPVNVIPVEPLTIQATEVVQPVPELPVVQDIQTFEPIIAPTQVQPSILPISIEQPVDTTQVIPTLAVDPFVYSQDTGAQNLNLTQTRPLITATYDNLETPALQIYPTTTTVQPAVTTDFGTTNFDNFDFSTFNNETVVVPDVAPVVEPVATTDAPEFNYDDFDFSSLNLDDLFAAAPAE